MRSERDGWERDARAAIALLSSVPTRVAPTIVHGMHCHIGA
jgi:hypothetical protein